ncbi:MAG: thiamine-phosphate kinase [Bacteroidota bacterium]
MSENQENRTELAQIGEFGLIHRLTKNIELFNNGTIKGVGDDAAVIKSSDKLILFSTDLLVEGIHFDLSYYPLKHLGYKAAVVNVSDIIAMNGTPRHLTVSLAVSNRFPLEALEEIYAGIQLACGHYKVDLVGGDTSSSHKGLILSLSILGDVAPDEVVYRSTAQKGDLLCVSGDLGGAYMGLMLLEREKQVFKADPTMQPDLEGFDYILERQLKPEARNDITELLRKNGIKPTSMIDISDGLASEAIHICTESALGCAIYEEKIPIDVVTAGMAEEFKMEPAIAALNGGEDYELLFTIKQEDFEKVSAIPGISIIGHMTAADEGARLIGKDGGLVPLQAQGWDAFK